MKTAIFPAPLLQLGHPREYFPSTFFCINWLTWSCPGMQADARYFTHSFSTGWPKLLISMSEVSLWPTASKLHSARGPLDTHWRVKAIQIASNWMTFLLWWIRWHPVAWITITLWLYNIRIRIVLFNCLQILRSLCPLTKSSFIFRITKRSVIGSI